MGLMPERGDERKGTKQKLGGGRFDWEFEVNWSVWE